MKPSVLVGGRLPSSVMARLEDACDVDRVEGGTPTHDELVARIPGKQGLLAMITNTVDRALLDAGRDLRIVANAAVGYNNIDVAAARERGIIVTNTPDVLTQATADFTWALILGITRRLGEGERLVRRGGWKGWAFDFMLATELRGKQLGIVGYGRIGKAVAARAAAFGMEVAHTSRSHPTAQARGPHGADLRRGVEECAAGTPGSGGGMPLDRLLSTSDVVSLHVPLTPDTTHLIDQPALARMKRNAYLINTARGPVVDEPALAWALKNRLIAGAALDVYEQEPVVHPELLTLENVLLAPHMASGTTETRTAMADLAARNVIAVLSGQLPLTPVS
ncbi:MAG TPA: D-glycerate dehydrogenase [Vicinamibacterales bacterium]